MINREKGKGKIIESLGYDSIDKEHFCEVIFKHVCANYIYNLKKNAYGDLMFNVCVELPTITNHIRKTMVALKYYPNNGVVEIVTIT